MSLARMLARTIGGALAVSLWLAPPSALALPVVPDLVLPGEQAGSEFGRAISTAGDVNGDGVSDFLISAPGFDSTGVGADAGKVYLYLGRPPGSAPILAWSLAGVTAASRRGASLSTAGDVDGDGYDDVAVGSPGYSDGEANEGAVDVYYGSPTGLAATPSFHYELDVADLSLGYALAAAGDVNGDGYDDLLASSKQRFLVLGLPHEQGRVYVLYGSALGLQAVGVTVITGNVDEDFGFALAGAGDLDGDGYDDVAVGSPAASFTLGSEGAVTLHLGSLDGIGPNPDITYQGDHDQGRLGYSVAFVGDLNGDGYSELAMGEPGWESSPATPNTGRVTLIHGGALPPTPITEPGPATGASFGHAVATPGDVDGDGFADLMVSWPGSVAGAEHVSVFLGGPSGVAFGSPSLTDSSTTGSGLGFGQTVATLGDIDGDGFGDYAIGQPATSLSANAGEVHVYLGRAELPNAVADLTLTPPGAESDVGRRTQYAGDVNGDGYDDVVVSRPEADVAYFHPGGPQGPSVTPTTSIVVDPNPASETYAQMAGDVNGDGFDDLLVTSTYFSGVHRRGGKAWLFRGTASGPSFTPSWSYEGVRDSAGLWAVAEGRGDVNADGYADVLLTSPEYSGTQVRQGKVYLFYGSASGPSLTPDWTMEGADDSVLFGFSAAHVGDVNRDGFDDLLIGSPSSGSSKPSRAGLWLGGPSGPATGSPSWELIGASVGDEFGYAVAGAGDVDGDGFSDVLVGLPGRKDVGGDPRGGVALAFGGPTGPPGPGVVTLDGTPGFDHFGRTLRGGGDVDADGFADFVAANGRDNGPLEVALYLGAPNPSLTAALTLSEVNAPSPNGMIEVDVAGDANGDGFSDLLEARTLSVGANHVRLHFGDGGRGVNRPFVMRTSDQARRIALLGRSNDDDGFGLRAWTRTPKGRGRLRVQWEVESVGAPFDGVGLQQTAFAMSPAPVNGVGSLQSFDGFASGVSPGARQHVRVRTQTRSPFFPRSPWFSPQGNGATEADLSTSGTPVSVGDPDGLPAMLALAPPYPNPASRAVTFAFTLPRAGEVELAIFDLAGRRVASVVAGLRAAGTQRARWDGRDAAGGEAKQGVYFAKLTSGGRSVARKVIVLGE